MDLIGCASYAFPVVGEVADVLWAPISALIFYRLFGGSAFAAFGGVFNFMEELFPGTDIIPCFTLGWVVQRVVNGRKTATEQKFATVVP
ncbi:hypothetical protein [Chitinophaga costaii]|nr:hypothetical protein [Chitinophaga costaii]